MGAPMFGMKYNTIQVEPVSGALGAEVRGVDLAKDLSAEVVADLNRALMDHLVIFFRDQVMTPEQQKAFARRFGELHIHPITEPMKGHPEIIEVIKEADELGNWGDEWHTDLTALREPPMGSILYAKEVPPFSGDTQFSNMYLAYETLSSDLRHFLDGRVCHHRQNLSGYSGYKSMANKSSTPSDAEHPLVRTHPVTGKKALFLARPGAGLIKGLSPAESEAIFALLYRHAENPDFACRFRWKKNSVAFWDNRCTRHRVTADYFYAQRGFEPHRRHMHRVTVQGDRPA
jgi:taurine dioxygenase